MGLVMAKCHHLYLRFSVMTEAPGTAGFWGYHSGGRWDVPAAYSSCKGLNNLGQEGQGLQTHWVGSNSPKTSLVPRSQPI